MNILNAQVFQFERISNELGLSQNLISALYQDQAGFIWVGTKDGLNRYDGYSFKVYQNDPYDSTSISSNFIKSIYEDSQGRLWIGTTKGLNLLDRKKDCFLRLLLNTETHQADSPIVESQPDLNHQHVRSITEDDEGNIWLGTHKGGVVKMTLPAEAIDASEAKCTIFSRTESEHSLWDNSIVRILIDPSGRIWVHSIDRICYIEKGSAGNYGIHRFDWEDFDPLWKGYQAAYFTYRFKDKDIVDKRFNSIFPGADKAIWIKTAGGFSKWNSKKKAFEWYHLDLDLEDYPILPLKGANGQGLIDKNGRIWMTGLWSTIIYDPNSFKILGRNHIEEGASIGIPNSGTQSILEDRAGNIWMGTNGLGLYKYSPGLKKFMGHKNATLWKGQSIRSIYKTRDGLVWFGTTGLKMYQYNRKTDLIKPIILDSRWHRTHDTELDVIYVIQEDNDGNLWLGGERGLFKLMRKDGEIVDWKFFQVHKDKGEGDHSYNSVFDIHFDKEGQMWLITHFEFGSFDPITGIFDGTDYLSITDGEKLQTTLPTTVINTTTNKVNNLILDEMPTWLTSPNNSFNVPVNGKSINFDFNGNEDIGTYTDTATIVGMDIIGRIPSLRVEMQVKACAPFNDGEEDNARGDNEMASKSDTGDFTDSMEMVLNWRFIPNGAVSTDTFDQIQVRMNGTPRGSGRIIKFGSFYAANFMIYGNADETGGDLEFVVWNSDQALAYVPVSGDDINFEPGLKHGIISNPEILLVEDDLFQFNNRIYVDSSNVSGVEDGTSWNTAYTDMQDAIAQAYDGDTIWIAGGTYYPSINDRSTSFDICNDIAIHGGFDGDEVSLSQRSGISITTLSGNIGSATDSTDNTYHVVTTSADALILDRISIEDGQADGIEDDNKGGCLVNTGTLTLKDCHMKNGFATMGGKLIYNSGSLTIDNGLYFIKSDNGISSLLNDGNGIVVVRRNVEFKVID